MNAFWIDKKGNAYTSNMVKDSHLLNIISYLKKGGLGYKGFATKQVVQNILDEAFHRHLITYMEHNNDIKDIQEIRNELSAYRLSLLDKFFKNNFERKEMNR